MANDAEIDAVAKALHAAGELGSSWDEAGDMRDVYRQDARAAIEALDAVRSQGRYRHKKRGGTYALLGTAEAQASAPINEGEPIAVYRCDADGRLWARPLGEFDDGRFEPLPPPPKEGA